VSLLRLLEAQNGRYQWALQEGNALVERAEIELRYEGYLQRQLQEVERLRQSEALEIPEDFDYRRVRGLSAEALEKLERIRPRSIGQAARIAGVSPADLAMLLLYLR
jgi:NAD/FAD-utilizing enzyme apparently involved in cell division